ncbi:MAG: hypothetical protein M1814_001363 [Vezdaea aestivalis]|nr:MAG: hypothetical protein M1814_001363 [Vezdaea aestivalis]
MFCSRKAGAMLVQLRRLPAFNPALAFLYQTRTITENSTSRGEPDSDEKSFKPSIRPGVKKIFSRGQNFTEEELADVQRHAEELAQLAQRQDRTPQLESSIESSRVGMHEISVKNLPTELFQTELQVKAFTDHERRTFDKLLGPSPTIKPSRTSTSEDVDRIRRHNELYQKIFYQKRSRLASEEHEEAEEDEESEGAGFEIPWEKIDKARSSERVPESQSELRIGVDGWAAGTKGAQDLDLTVSKEKVIKVHDVTVYSAPVSDEVERVQEYQTISKSIGLTETDLEIYEVLREEVFPLMHRLLRSKDDDVRDKKKQAKKKPQRADARLMPLRRDFIWSDLTKERPLALEPLPDDLKAKASHGVPSKTELDIARKIYGPLMELAVHRLLTVFRSPGGILGLYSKICKLGVLSRVLGLSTTVYNALIQVHGIWYHDLASVDETLAQMESQGFDFDCTTLALLERIVADAEWEVDQLRLAKRDWSDSKPRVGGLRLSGLLGWESVARVTAWRDKIARETRRVESTAPKQEEEAERSNDEETESPVTN